MKIALVLFPVNDLGGIISHVENLALGLRELGHTVNFHMLFLQSNFRQPRDDFDLVASKKGWSFGAFCAVHPMFGWNAIPGIHKLSYGDQENLKRTKEKLSEYDVLIWEVPVPTKQKTNLGNNKWASLYKSCNRNIAVIHDGNVLSTPWIATVGKMFKGLACVHECAYNSSRPLGIARSLILNPQNLIGVDFEENYMEREKGFLSVQVFKSWKHVDDVLRAIPHLPRDIRKIVAGGGIEQRYMVSPDKTKERYYCGYYEEEDNPEAVERNNVRIWDRALHYGMEWLGPISEFKRDLVLRQIRTLIDPSWSNTHFQHGAHFNRTVVEAMKQGAVPIGTNLGMAGDEDGDGMIFENKENYIMIPYDYPPKEYAQVIEYANNLSKNEASKIIENNFLLLEHFDRKKVAQDFIDLAMGRNAGYLEKRVKAKMDIDVYNQGMHEMKTFFRYEAKSNEKAKVHK